MILKLVRTNLQSDWLSISIAAASSLAIWITTIGKEMPGYTTIDSMNLGLCPFAILIFAVAARRGVQKRRRLLAQLPVTATAARISSWLSYFTIVACACLIGVAILFISPPAPEWGWAGFARDAGRTIAVFTCCAALWRILGLCMSMRPPYNFIATMAAVWLFSFLWIAAVASFGVKVPSRDDVTIPWPLFLQVTAGITLALILVEILLDRFVDNRIS